MKLKTLMIALVVAAVVPTAALADPASASDKANAARSCVALRTSMGATFTATYKTFGACASAWTRAEHQNRHEALTACQAAHPDATAGVVQKCVQAKLRAERLAARQATVSAARACKTERTSMGASAFATKYGGAANAFGKCVSKLATAKLAAQG